jgi:hypothetical protein
MHSYVDKIFYSCKKWVLHQPATTLEQVLAMQAQMPQTMQQTLVNLHAQPQALPPPRDRLGDF